MQSYCNGACRAVCVASGLIDEVPSKDRGVLAVGPAIDGVDPAGQGFGIVLVQLHDCRVGEEVHMVCNTSKLVVQVHPLHPVVHKSHDDLRQHNALYQQVP